MAETKQAAPDERPINVVVWTIVSAVLIATRVIRLTGIYPLGKVWLVAVIGDVVRAAAVGALGVLLECTLRTSAGRTQRALRWLWGVALISGLAVALDGVVDAQLGYHVTTGLGIVFSGGVAGLATAVEAVGVSPRSLLEGLLVVLLLAWLLWSVFRVSERVSARLGVVISSRLALWATLGLSGATVIDLLLSPVLKPPEAWEEERRTLAFDMYPQPVDPSLVSVRVATAPPPPVTVTPRAATTRPDVLLVVIETFRRDALTAENTPALEAFARTPSTHLLTALTSGNVTHYAWFGLFTGQYPFAYDRTRARGGGAAPPIDALLRGGYRVVVFSSAGLDYLQLATTVFGRPGEGFEIVPEPPQPEVTARDHAMVEQFLSRVDREEKGGHLYVVSFNSSHFDYSTPEAPSAMKQPELPLREALRFPAEVLQKRYRASLRYVDSQVAALFEGLRARGRFDELVVVVTGDHGEAFGEHGVFAHGTDLSREQIEVPLVVRLPAGSVSAQSPLLTRTRVAHVDVMPTLLEEVGLLSAVPLEARAGVPLQREGPYGPRVVVQGWSRDSSRFAWVDGEQKLVLEFDTPDPFAARRLRWAEVSSLDDHPVAPVGLLQSVEQLPSVLRWVRYE